MGIFRKKSPDAASLPSVADDGNEWSVAQGVYDGKPLIVRMNLGARRWAGASSMPIKLGFAIPLRAPEANGLPSAEENARLGEIEDLIVGAVAERTPGVFALVLTTGGMREFVFYVPERVDFAELHKALERAVDTHEVQCMAERDPKWRSYADFAAQ